ncbi:uncharacterized protein LOC128547843 [Mercenaria mercenaria]|uniref:uncharacterized protein LOC128547843 n=1 Tax=Mercenaria mercenaria TaxID=6596 RepID=UPI00234F4CEA|nr:uncharacterized protein LOC128547843 [Mercenaria mercenaria]XP_053377287.1 uncharacterized protein LOC128547843 [Mercenaria mercenaria]
MFDGCERSNDFLDRWNYEAATINRQLHAMVRDIPWLNVMILSDFHTMFGARRQMFSRDGLHLSYDGTSTLASNIVSAVFSISPTSETTSSVGPQVDENPIVSNTEQRSKVTPSDPPKTVTKPDVPMMLRNRPQKCKIVLIETDTKFYLSTDVLSSLVVGMTHLCSRKRTENLHIMKLLIYSIKILRTV